MKYSKFWRYLQKTIAEPGPKAAATDGDISNPGWKRKKKILGNIKWKYIYNLKWIKHKSDLPDMVALGIRIVCKSQE